MTSRLLVWRSSWQVLCSSILLASVVACGGGGADAGGNTGSALSAAVSGSGTFYAADGSGQCSFDASPDNLMVAALNPSDFEGSAACGTYIRATGPKGSVTVRVVDLCPGCAKGDIDFSAEAFKLIGDPAVGRVAITWKKVVGDVSGPVSYRYEASSSIYWFGIQVLNHRLPIASLEIRPSGAPEWIKLARSENNYFEYPTQIAAGTLQVRITSSTGAVLTDTLPQPSSGTTVAGKAQFP